MASEASEEITTRFIHEIEAAFEPIRHFPLSGPSRGHLAPALRVTFRAPYAIYYVPRPDAVVIIRVLHGAREVTTIAEQGGFS